ncbi:hypothetical protein ACS5UA_15875 [Brucella sp. RRSP16]
MQTLIEDLIALAQQADALADQMRPLLAAIETKEAEIRTVLSGQAATHIAGRYGNAKYAHSRSWALPSPERDRTTEQMILSGYANEIAAFPPPEAPEGGA